MVHFIYQWRVQIESLIDSGTWDPTDENMLSIDPYEILRKKIHIEDFEQSGKWKCRYFLDNNDLLLLQDKEFDYFDFRQIWEEYIEELQKKISISRYIKEKFS